MDIEIELLKKKSYMDILDAKCKIFLDKWITRKKDVIWEKFWKFILWLFWLNYQE